MGSLDRRGPRCLGSGPEEVAEMDLAYVAGVVACLALSWGLVRLCEKVG